MKKILLLSVALVTVALILSSCSSLLQYNNITGTWLVEYTLGQASYTDNMTINQSLNNTLTVYDNTNDYYFTGTINGNIVQFSGTMNGVTLTFTGTVSDLTTMSGNVVSTWFIFSSSGTWGAVEQN